MYEMCSSASPSSLLLPNSTRQFWRGSHVPIFGSSKAALGRGGSTKPRPCLAAAVSERNLDLSWFASNCNANSDYGGWAVVEAPLEKKIGKKGLSTFVLGGIGTSIAVLVAAIAHFSLTRKDLGFQFHSPLSALQGMLIAAETRGNGSKTVDSDIPDAEPVGLETSPECKNNASCVNVASASMGKLERILIPAAVDSAQHEALFALKKLKIIEDDIKADELCTRREYARWLVGANSILERNPKHRIIPSMLLSGPVVAAFDDVSAFDPDFWSIQALAEAGIIPSKLSVMNSSSNLNNLDRGSLHFSPERFISRQDMINWKAQLEYELMPGIEERIAKAKGGFMDVREISLDASPELFMDILAGDNSILRKVFGKSKRFQPSKPSTKAQAAVALASGRMTEVIFNELSRLEAENSSREAEMEEIKTELLCKGDIQRFWDEKLEEGKNRGSEVERAYLTAVNDLEQEKFVQEKNLAEFLKEKAAIDCQRQLLLSLKEEVNEMSERLACERANYMAEQCNLQDMLRDLQTKQEGMLDAKSLLGAEKEAVRILRSWVEDEARKNQARAKVLEEVGRRWKWESQS